MGLFTDDTKAPIRRATRRRPGRRYRLLHDVFVAQVHSPNGLRDARIRPWRQTGHGDVHRRGRWPGRGRPELGGGQPDLGLPSDGPSGMCWMTCRRLAGLRGDQRSQRCRRSSAAAPCHELMLAMHTHARIIAAAISSRLVSPAGSFYEFIGFRQSVMSAATPTRSRTPTLVVSWSWRNPRPLSKQMRRRTMDAFWKRYCLRGIPTSAQCSLAHLAERMSPIPWPSADCWHDCPELFEGRSAGEWRPPQELGAAFDMLCPAETMTAPHVAGMQGCRRCRKRSYLSLSPSVATGPHALPAPCAEQARSPC